MAKYDIFISYSSRDKAPAEFCGRLEQRGLRCWIAPRDIAPGMPYARAIMQGLTETDTVLVFVSSNSLKSEDVLNEVDNAHGLKKNIVPIFIEKVELTPEFSYYLKRKQWINAFDTGIDPAVDQICSVVAPGSTAPQSAPAPERIEKARIGRNDPCPCGSGRKYKNCHGRGM